MRIYQNKRIFKPTHQELLISGAWGASDQSVSGACWRASSRTAVSGACCGASSATSGASSSGKLRVGSSTATGGASTTAGLNLLT